MKNPRLRASLTAAATPASAERQSSEFERCPPPWWLLGAEPLRAACEFIGTQCLGPKSLCKGDGHAVVLFPGLASDDTAMLPLKHLCRRLGYEAHGWGRGLNCGPVGDIDTWLDGLAQSVLALPSQATAGISLIGWSLGGIYAREVAKRLEGRVRQVITIGTPFAATHRTHAALAYRLLNGQRPPAHSDLLRQLATAPRAPTTSIYSRSDGVVSWQACLQDGGQGHTENVEVRGSHCGMAWNAQVFEIVADRLAQPARGWRPYVPVARSGRLQAFARGLVA